MAWSCGCWCWFFNSCCLKFEEVGLVGSWKTILFTKGGMFFLLLTRKLVLPLDMIDGEAPCRCKVGTPGQMTAFPLYDYVAVRAQHIENFAYKLNGWFKAKPRFLREKLLRRETGVDVKLQAKTFQRTRGFTPLLFPRTETKKNHENTVEARCFATDSFQSLLRWKLQILEPHQASDVRSTRGRSSWSFLGWNIICCCRLCFQKLRCYFKDFGVQGKISHGIKSVKNWISKIGWYRYTVCFFSSLILQWWLKRA